MKENYYRTLSNMNITYIKYEFAKEVCEKFKLKNLRELHDLHTDVMILEDVFESFIETALDNYKLDPAHIMTAPSLSLAACLR